MPGDCFFVQETWRTEKRYDRVKPSDLPDSARIHHEAIAPAPGWCGKLRPAIFLQSRFARAARYEVTQVRCEKVDEISEADADAECIGEIVRPGYRMNGYGFPGTSQHDAARTRAEGYARLWDSLHTKPGTRFADAPWVFAYTFRRVR